jgi:YNFM family putative membrane transporter
MKKSDFFIVVYTIIILLSVMYATQPLQPLLSQEFDVSVTKASSFTAVIMLFLAIAPIIYGYILQQVNAKKVLVVASILLSITNIFLGFSNSYELFLFLRTCEAVVIPAILTACMSILASDKQNIKRNMSFYVAATVFGGLIGRVMSGFIATQLGWRYVFFSLSVALLLGLFFIAKLQFEGEAKLTKATINDALIILKDKRFVVIYLLMFTVFFVFAGFLNVLPFRIKEQFSDVTETHIGLLYLGYGVGIVVSLMIHKIIHIFKKELHTIMFGLWVLWVSMILFFNSNIWFIFAVVFVLCFGMFTVHTVSTRLANSMRESQKSLTSGMYLTFYYIGGAVGSIVPSLVYEHLGWNSTIVMFIFALIAIAIFVHINKHHFKAYN